MSNDPKLVWDDTFVPPWNGLPLGDTCCSVQPLVNATLVLIDSELLEDGDSTKTRRPTFSFLIKHPSGKAVLFDLGVPRNWRKWSSEPEETQKEFEIEILHDLSTLVRQAGVDPQKISQIAISHMHWDHTGDPSEFSAATFLVSAEDADHIPALKGHPAIQHLDWTTSSKAIGTFDNSIDLFGDGSLVLCHAPGHTQGHLVALVRTDPDAYVLLAADGCHHTRLLGEKSTRFALWRDPSEPEDVPPKHSYHADFRTASQSLKRIRAMNDRGEVMVVLAHDEKLWAKWGQKSVGPELSGWQGKGYKA